MPTISQLPSASGTGSQDEIPVSQGGITRAVTVAELLVGTQAAMVIPSPSIMGRASLGPGAPEALAVGIGIAVQNASVLATGADHAGFASQPALNIVDEAILNSGGTPKRLALPLLRGLFSAGGNVAISGTGTISASTDPSVSTTLTTLTQGLATTNTNLGALTAKVPTSGYVTLNSQGQMTAPVAAPVGLGTISVAAGAPSRTLGAKALDSCNVVDFGAIAGGADCSAAFAAAFSALPAGGGEIYMPAGDYWLLSPLSLAGKAVSLRGAGKGATKLHFKHTGVGLDFAPGSLLNKVIIREFSGYAESSAGQTAALARVTYPSTTSFGYVSAIVSDIECFGYPNPANGTAPFPQTFLRGIVLNNCWSTHVHNLSWFGPPAAAGATASAVIEVNGSIDTRIHSPQAYYGNALVLQTGYCEGIYINAPLVVGVDYLVKQTDETTWAGWAPNKVMLLGLWVSNGEVNTNLGTVQLANVTDGFFVGLDITRNGGPNTQITLFDLTNVSNFHISACNFVGGPAGGSGQDIAFGFKSTWNSSSNVIGGCHFENLATVVNISGSNGTVGLTTYGLHLDNVPISTAFIDNSAVASANHVGFVAPPVGSIPAGIGRTTDHVFSGKTGAVLFRINNVMGASNYIRHQPSATNNSPAICFDGSDTTIHGVIETKGGNLYVNASAGGGVSGNLVSFINTPGAVNWPVVQNATSSNMSSIGTNSGGLSMQPVGALWLSPAGGLFAAGLPTARPASGSRQIWNNGGVVSIA